MKNQKIMFALFLERHLFISVNKFYDTEDFIGVYTTKEKVVTAMENYIIKAREFGRKIIRPEDFIIEEVVVDVTFDEGDD